MKNAIMNAVIFAAVADRGFPFSWRPNELEKAKALAAKVAADNDANLLGLFRACPRLMARTPQLTAYRAELNRLGTEIYRSL